MPPRFFEEAQGAPCYKDMYLDLSDDNAMLSGSELSVRRRSFCGTGWPPYEGLALCNLYTSILF